MLLEWTNELISLSINFVELSKTTYVNFTSWFYNNTGYQSKFYLSRYSLINDDKRKLMMLPWLMEDIYIFLFLRNKLGNQENYWVKFQ